MFVLHFDWSSICDFVLKHLKTFILKHIFLVCFLLDILPDYGGKVTITNIPYSKLPSVLTANEKKTPYMFEPPFERVENFFEKKYKFHVIIAKSDF